MLRYAPLLPTVAALTRSQLQGRLRGAENEVASLKASLAQERQGREHDAKQAINVAGELASARRELEEWRRKARELEQRRDDAEVRSASIAPGSSRHRCIFSQEKLRIVESSIIDAEQRVDDAVEQRVFLETELEELRRELEEQLQVRDRCVRQCGPRLTHACALSATASPGRD